MTRMFAGSEHAIKTNLRVYLSPLIPSARRLPVTRSDKQPYSQAQTLTSTRCPVEDLSKAYSPCAKAEIR
jgi:hypothetical protein